MANNKSKESDKPQSRKDLIAEKVSAGLTKEQAAEVVDAQIAHDEMLEETAKD